MCLSCSAPDDQSRETTQVPCVRALTPPQPLNRLKGVLLDPDEAPRGRTRGLHPFAQVVADHQHIGKFLNVKDRWSVRGDRFQDELLQGVNRVGRVEMRGVLRTLRV